MLGFTKGAHVSAASNQLAVKSYSASGGASVAPLVP